MIIAHHGKIHAFSRHHPIVYTYVCQTIIHVHVARTRLTHLQRMCYTFNKAWKGLECFKFILIFTAQARDT